MNPSRNSEERIDRLYRRYWNPKRVLTSYFLVYFTEGLVRSIMIVLPIYLLDVFALSTPDIGFITVCCYVPWHFKFLMGIALDVTPPLRGWRRRPYILLGTSLSVLGALWLANTMNVWLGILPAMIVLMTGDALIDTGVDALLLDIVPPDWHGFGLGTGWGARAIGYSISSILTWFVVSNYGWRSAFYAFCLYALPALYTLTIEEPPFIKERRMTKETVALTFTDPHILTVVGFAFLGCLSYGFDPTRGILSLITHEILGEEAHYIGYVTICFGTATAISSISMGRVIDKIGHKKGYYMSLLGSAMAIALWSLPLSGRPTELLVLAFMLGFFNGFNFISWEGVLADTIPPEFPAFMWQYFMGWLHVSAFISGIAISGLLKSHGVSFTVLCMATICLVGFIPAKLIRTLKTSKASELS